MSTNDISHSRIPADAAERWELVRRVCSGPQAVAAGDYLPTLNEQDKSLENKARNEAYKKRAVFYSVTGRTRDGLLGLAFRRDPDTAGIPARLQHLMVNADGYGTSIYQQSQKAVLSVLETGRHGLLVDYSESLKLPLIKAYEAEDIINWRTEVQDGSSRLTLLVLKELHEEADGYKTKIRNQWREFFINEAGQVVTRLWRQTDNAKMLVANAAGATDTVLQSSRGPLREIPFVFIGAQNNDESIDEAPLFDLAHLNIAHYRNSADYEDSVWFSGQAQPWISGLPEEWRDWLEKHKIYAGSRAPMLLPVGGAYGYAQPQPNTLVKEAMDQKELQMAQLGAQLLDQSHAAKTATQSDNEKEATTSVLAMVVANVSEAYGKAMQFCGEFLGQQFSPEPAYKINQDFVAMKADPTMIQAIVAGWQAGAYAKADARAYLRRLNVIRADRTDEDIDADQEEEGPTLSTEPALTEDDGERQ